MCIILDQESCVNPEQRCDLMVNGGVLRTRRRGIDFPRSIVIVWRGVSLKYHSKISLDICRSTKICYTVTKTLCLHMVAKPVKHDLVCCVGFSYCCLILLIVSHRPTRHRTRVDFYDYLQLRPVPMICSCQQVRFIKLSCSSQKYS
jgi:hypothetical protein